MNNNKRVGLNHPAFCIDGLSIFRPVGDKYGYLCSDFGLICIDTDISIALWAEWHQFNVDDLYKPLEEDCEPEGGWKPCFVAGKYSIEECSNFVIVEHIDSTEIDRALSKAKYDALLHFIATFHSWAQNTDEFPVDPIEEYSKLMEIMGDEIKEAIEDDRVTIPSHIPVPVDSEDTEPNIEVRQLLDLTLVIPAPTNTESAYTFAIQFDRKERTIGWMPMRDYTANSTHWKPPPSYNVTWIPLQ